MATDVAGKIFDLSGSPERVPWDRNMAIESGLTPYGYKTGRGRGTAAVAKPPKILEPIKDLMHPDFIQEYLTANNAYNDYNLAEFMNGNNVFSPDPSNPRAMESWRYSRELFKDAKLKANKARLMLNRENMMINQQMQGQTLPSGPSEGFITGQDIQQQVQARVYKRFDWGGKQNYNVSTPSGKASFNEDTAAWQEVFDSIDTEFKQDLLDSGVDPGKVEQILAIQRSSMMKSRPRKSEFKADKVKLPEFAKGTKKERDTMARLRILWRIQHGDPKAIESLIGTKVTTPVGEERVTDASYDKADGTVRLMTFLYPEGVIIDVRTASGKVLYINNLLNEEGQNIYQEWFDQVDSYVPSEQEKRDAREKWGYVGGDVNTGPSGDDGKELSDEDYLKQFERK